MPTPGGGGYVAGSGQVGPGAINSEDILDNDIVNADIDDAAAIAGSKVAAEDDAYGAGWNGDLNPPSKNALYDKIETLTTTEFKNGTTTRAGNTASGAQTIAHGLGRTPKLVRITATWPSAATGTANLSISEGVYNGTTNSSVWGVQESASENASGGVDNTNGVHLVDNSGSQVAVITVDGTNITLTWTRAGGTGAANMNIMWEVYG